MLTKESIVSLREILVEGVSVLPVCSPEEVFNVGFRLSELDEVDGLCIG